MTANACWRAALFATTSLSMVAFLAAHPADAQTVRKLTTAEGGVFCPGRVCPANALARTGDGGGEQPQQLEQNGATVGTSTFNQSAAREVTVTYDPLVGVTYTLETGATLTTPMTDFSSSGAVVIQARSTNATRPPGLRM